MGGIEVFAAMVIFILSIIGIIRGSAKELGVTMALVVLLAVFTQFDALVDFNQMPTKVNNILASFGLESGDVMKQRMVVLFLYSSAVVLTIFLAYHGQETLAFRLKDPSGIAGVALGGLVGAFNGYLTFGTIWYYLHQLNYPIQRYGWFRAEFTELARNWINLLPQNIMGGVVLSALALGLLWWRILK